MSRRDGLRPDLALVADQIFDGSRVLDLGCGEGILLDHLIRRRGCRGTGVEIDPDAVLAAIRRGVPVIDRDIDVALADLADDSYDTMARVAERMIVSVPNFGYYPNRLRLLGGRMPISKEIPYAWYNSPNLRFTTLTDLEDLFDHLGLVIDRRFTYTQSGRRLRMSGRVPNLMAGAAVYVLRPAGRVR